MVVEISICFRALVFILRKSKNSKALSQIDKAFSEAMN